MPVRLFAFMSIGSCEGTFRMINLSESGTESASDCLGRIDRVDSAPGRRLLGRRLGTRAARRLSVSLRPAI